ncbi:cation-dependent mannose-6-phosphate receptor-like [Diadema setosum]|uniref:cation-dependent mannose-6-phosphate receptor-like n=1 Tax=Diadema setosum TaxID=31175 RepID=UPI003B3ABAE8
MMNVFQFVCALILLHNVKRGEGQQECKALVGGNKCSCSYSDTTTGTSKVFDFTVLGKQSGGPAFPYQGAVQKPDDYVYAYNPCYPFTDGMCTNVAACQKNKGGTIFYDIGDPNTPAFSVENGDIVITYTTSDARTSKVYFHCDASAKKKATYIVQGELSTGTYTFTINTCLACVNDVAGCMTGSSGLTAGGVICIVFTVLVVVYFVGGILFMKYVRGAQGKEVIPNYDFWSDFPALVKDGVMHLVGLCRGDSTSGYESIK